MASKKPTQGKPAVSQQERRMKTYRWVFVIISIIVVLSMILSAVATF